MTKLAQLFDDQLACRRHPINDKKTFEQVFISNNKPNYTIALLLYAIKDRQKTSVSRQFNSIDAKIRKIYLHNKYLSYIEVTFYYFEYVSL